MRFLSFKSFGFLASASHALLILCILLVLQSLSLRPVWGQEKDNGAGFNFTDYYNGRYLKASAALRDEMLNPNNSIKDRLDFATSGSEVCARAFDYSCALDFNERALKLIKILETKTAEQDNSKRMRFMSELLDFLKISWKIDGSKNISRQLIVVIETHIKSTPFVDDPLWHVYANIYLSAYYKAFDNDKGREYLERAWYQFLTLEEKSGLTYVHISTEVINALLQYKYFKRASNLTKIVRVLADKMIMSASYEAIRFYLASAQVALYEGDRNRELNDLGVVLSLIKKIEVPIIAKSNLLNEVESQVLTSCFGVEHYLCADKNNIYEHLNSQVSKIENPQEKFEVAFALAMMDFEMSRDTNSAAKAVLSEMAKSLVMPADWTLSPRSLKLLVDLLQDAAELDEEQRVERLSLIVAEEASFIRRVTIDNESSGFYINSNQLAIFSLFNIKLLSLRQILTGRENALLLTSMELLAKSRFAYKTHQSVSFYSEGSSKKNRQTLYFQRYKEEVGLLEKKIIYRQVDAVLGNVKGFGEFAINDKILSELDQIKGIIDLFPIDKQRNEVLTESSLLGRVQDVLNEREAFLIYNSIGQDFLVMCVTKSEVFTGLTRFDRRQLIIDLKIMQAALSNPSAPSVAIDASFPFASTARISSLIFAKVRGCLKSADHIIFNHDASLEAVSLHALLDITLDSSDDIRNLNNRTAPWLGLRFSISTSEGAEGLVASRSRNFPRRNVARYLGFADPKLRGKSVTDIAMRGATLRGGLVSLKLSDLEELPNTLLEVENAARVFGAGSVTLTALDATEAKFKSLPLDDFSVIQLSTHGLVKEEIEGLGEPALVFTPFDSKSDADDGIVTATDISRLSIDSDLIIISACNSARSNFNFFGSEISSLSSAFTTAGARAVLGSMWSVNTNSTEILLGYFNNYYATSGLSGVESLRMAMNKMVESEEKYSHPRFWASFILHGDSRVKWLDLNFLESQIKNYNSPRVVNNPIRSLGSGHISSSLSKSWGSVIAGATSDLSTGVFKGVVFHVRDDVILSKAYDDNGFYTVVSDFEKLGETLLIWRPREVDDNFPFRLYALSESGALSLVREMPRLSGETVVSGVVLPDRKSLILHTLVLASGSEKGLNRVLRFDLSSGRLVGVFDFRDSSDLNTDSVHLSVIDNKIFVSRNVRPLDPNPPFSLSSLSSFRVCNPQVYSEIYTFDGALKLVGYTRVDGKLLGPLTELSKTQGVVGFSQYERCLVESVSSGFALVDLYTLSLKFRSLEFDVGSLSIPKILVAKDRLIFYGSLSRSYANVDLSEILSGKINDLMASFFGSRNRQTGFYIKSIHSESFEVEWEKLDFFGYDIYLDSALRIDSKTFYFFGTTARDMFSLSLSFP